MNEIPTEQDYEAVYNARVIVLTDNKGADHNAALLWSFFGTDYCAELGQHLLNFVQAERMRGKPTIQEIIEQSEQYGAYL